MRRYTVNTLRRERLADQLVAAYVEWRETCARVRDTYRSWASDTSPADRIAFGLYMAALDAEEQAAEIYAGLVQRFDKLPRREHSPTDPFSRPACGDGWRP
jgi:hypothetical protein